LSLGKRMVLKTTTLSWINFSIIHWIYRRTSVKGPS
jgi:hypothetical protein